MKLEEIPIFILRINIDCGAKLKKKKFVNDIV